MSPKRRPRILLVSDTRDWHARRMEAAYEAAGAQALRVDLARCDFDTTRRSGLALPGFEDRLPDAVHVRTMGAGGFEAVTKRLGVLHALSALGVRTWNDARAIERCVDKSTTSFLLARAGLPTPATWTAETRAEAAALVAREAGSGALVLKPLFGSQGKGLRLIRKAQDLPAPQEIGGVYYLQRFVATADGGFHDFRLFTLRGAVIGAMMRRGASWITNVKQGGEPVAVARDTRLEALARAAAASLGAEIAGVDILIGRDGPTVLEVNSMPAWSGLQKVTPHDIAARIAQAVLADLPPPIPDGPR